MSHRELLQCHCHHLCKGWASRRHRGKGLVQCPEVLSEKKAEYLGVAIRADI
jgi:hypothetical protein